LVAYSDRLDDRQRSTTISRSSTFAVVDSSPNRSFRTSIFFDFVAAVAKLAEQLLVFPDPRVEDPYLHVDHSRVAVVAVVAIYSPQSSSSSGALPTRRGPAR